MIIFILIVIILLAYVLLSLKQVRPMDRGLIETFGKYSKFANAGLHFIALGIQELRVVNITEKMIDAKPQEIITADNLNAIVDAQVYFKIKEDEDSVKKSQYNVNNCEFQIVQLARTTLRNIIGTMTLKECNSERNKINIELLNALVEETKNWGVDIVRTELKEIQPPEDVQRVMNEVVIAANTKVAAIDFATAEETKADGMKRAEIKKAEGEKQARILDAQAQKEAKMLIATGEAESIKVVNNAIEESFTEKAQLKKKLETLQASLENNSKIVISKDGDILNVIGDVGNILPLKK